MASKAVPQLDERARLLKGDLRPSDQQMNTMESPDPPKIAAPPVSVGANVEKSGRGAGQGGE